MFYGRAAGRVGTSYQNWFLMAYVNANANLARRDRTGHKMLYIYAACVAIVYMFVVQVYCLVGKVGP